MVLWFQENCSEAQKKTDQYPIDFEMWNQIKVQIDIFIFIKVTKSMQSFFNYL